MTSTFLGLPRRLRTPGTSASVALLSPDLAGTDVLAESLFTAECMLGLLLFLKRTCPRFCRAVFFFAGAPAGITVFVMRRVSVSREVDGAAGPATDSVAFNAALPLGLLFGTICDGGGSAERFMPAILALRRGGGGGSGSWPLGFFTPFRGWR